MKPRMCATRLLRMSAAKIGPNRFHQNRTIFGAALVSEWNGLPTDVQRRLFEHSASGKSHDAALLKARIARPAQSQRRLGFSSHSTGVDAALICNNIAQKMNLAFGVSRKVLSYAHPALVQPGFTAHG
jgi:hypothetical protein